MPWWKILLIILQLVRELKDTDGDGVADVFDKFPQDPAKS